MSTRTESEGRQARLYRLAHQSSRQNRELLGRLCCMRDYASPEAVAIGLRSDVLSNRFWALFEAAIDMNRR